MYTVCHPQAEMDEAQIRVKDAFCMVMLIGNQVEGPCESPEERDPGPAMCFVPTVRFEEVQGPNIRFN